MRVVMDDEVRRVPAEAAVRAMRSALVEAATGGLQAPPRVRCELQEIDYVFTVGALADGTSGFRCYRAGEPPADQLTAVWDAAGRLRGVIVGDELGARRTGALGAVAVDVLARADAHHVGIIGSGRQAWTQLWAMTAVRRLELIRVYSPDTHRREQFATRARTDLGVDVRAVADASEAAADADIVVLATRSTAPVIDAASIRAGTHVTTVGPKARDGHEAPLQLIERAALVTCDSLQQAAAYPDPFFAPVDQLVPLGDVLTGVAAGRRNNADITVHCSVGLAGSEVQFARDVLDLAGVTDADG